MQHFVHYKIRVKDQTRTHYSAYVFDTREEAEDFTRELSKCENITTAWVTSTESWRTEHS